MKNVNALEYSLGCASSSVAKYRWLEMAKVLQFYTRALSFIGNAWCAASIVPCPLSRRRARTRS
jgi:hypothetical protein